MYTYMKLNFFYNNGPFYPSNRKVHTLVIYVIEVVTQAVPSTPPQPHLHSFTPDVRYWLFPVAYVKPSFYAPELDS